MIIEWLLVIAVMLYVLDKLICLIYCSIKKNSSYSKSRNKEITDGNSCNKAKHKGIKWCVKQLLYGWIMYSVKRLGKVPFQKYRIFILKNVYKMSIAKKVVIYGDFKIRAPWNITVDEGTVIGDGAQLDGRNGLYIGKNVNISSDVYIYTEQHDVNDLYFESGQSGGPVIIRDRAWLSSRTTVLPGVVVEEGAVLASGALTAKNLEPFSIYVGIPAKKIAIRNRDLLYEFNGEYIPFY